MLTLRTMGAADLGLIETWLRDPEVARWYLAATTIEDELDDLRLCMDGQEQTEVLIAAGPSGPIGWCQWYLCDDYPDHAAGVEAAPGDAGVIADPEASNVASRRVLEKNGFQLLAERPVASEPTPAPMAIYRLPPRSAVRRDCPRPAGAGADGEIRRVTGSAGASSRTCEDRRWSGMGDLPRLSRAGVLDGIIMGDGKVFRADLARSVRLFRAFRTEQESPVEYYTALAQDTVRQLGQYVELAGQVVVDVGGGPGFFVRELGHAGALSFGVDADSGEMAALGPAEKGSIAGSAVRLPIASEVVDVCFSSNVLEHVRDWRAMLAEMVRVTKPGGVVFVTFTNWLSPYGGHETSPWHYLGGERAVARYQRRHGAMPKNRFGHSLHPVSVAEVLAWARTVPGVIVVDAVPRYLPGWTRPLLRAPVLREFLTWNLLLVLRRERETVAP